MLNKIIGFSVKNKLIVALFVIGLILFGFYETTQLPIDAVPDITNNQVQIITVAPSYGATDIERLVTFPVEQISSNIKGLKEVRSFSRFGLSLVTLVFDDATDVYWARQQVAERLQQVQNEIPAEIGKPQMGPISTGLGEIYQYVVKPKKGYEKKYDEIQLRTIQDWIVRRQLLNVKGVAEVSSFGGKLKRYEIAVNANKLQAANIGIDDIFSALSNNNQNTGGSYIEKGPSVLFIRSEGLIGSIEDIQNIYIKSTESGTPVFIKDVADVSIGFSTRYGAICYNDEGEVAGAIVMMLKGANSSKVIKDVKERIAIIQKMLPEGVEIEAFLDRTKMVNNAIGTVETNLMEGALIVLFILVLFLGNFRAGLLVASVIPLSMLFAIILMNIFGVSGNLMSLGALDFGLIVDGAVIIVEAVMHQLSHSKKYTKLNLISQSEMNEQVAFSAGKMMNSAVFGQLIILIVYLPIFTLHGIEGKMFKPMAQTVVFALLGAFVLSLTYVPMMSSWILSKKIKHEPTFSDKLISRLQQWFERYLIRALRFRKTILITVFIVFVTAVFTMFQLGGEFIPALEEGDFAVDTRVLTGSSIATTIENTQKAAHILKTEFPEVIKVVTKIGSGEVPTDPMPMEASDMMVILKDKKEWTSASGFNELAEKMTQSLNQIPGITVGFQYPVQMRFNELMTGARQDVVCKIFGENLDTLANYAHHLGKIVNTVKGCENLYIETVTGVPQIIINFNRASLAQYSLSINQINQIVNTAFAGQSAGLVFEGERRFDLVVRLDTIQRKSIENVRNLLIPLSNGAHIPLNQLAEVDIKNGPNQIQREDAKRRIVIGFNVRGRDVQSIVNELKEKVDNSLKFPSGYYVTYGGAFENLNAAKQRLMIAVPISLILIFLLLFFAFHSVKQGLLIYSAIPLSAIGGIFFLALRGMPFSISAGVGFIALFGVAVLNGIVLIAEFNRLKMEGWNNLYRIVIYGTKLRLRPVLMTACVASLGFLPMAISQGAGAEVQRPLATVVIGGLLVATLLTLFVLPILYCIVESKKPRTYKQVLGLGFIFLFANVNQLSAQSTINIQAAIDSSLKNNLSLRSEKLMAEYRKKLIQSANEIPQTNVSLGYGQINSIYKDNSFGVSQSINFPTVYKNQKSVLNEDWKIAMLQVNLKEAETRKFCTSVFYNLLILREKEKLLMHADTTYQLFLEKAELRFKAGASSVLEKVTAESQRGNILMQLQALQQEIELNKLQFQLIMHADTYYEPVSEFFKMPEPETISVNLENHPALKIMEQKKVSAISGLRLERSRFLPDLSFSYYNMSMQGMGADDKMYGSSSRFSSAQIGIGIPLFFGAQHSKIRAGKSAVTMAENNLVMEQEQMEANQKSLFVQYQSNKQIINYYENTSLKNAGLILETANKQFLNGEINYLDWVLLINQYLTIKTNYLDLIQKSNDLIISINYLTLSK